MKTILALTFAVAICSGGAAAQQSSTEKSAPKQSAEPLCPMGDAHSGMNERGAAGMGFSQTATTHHFFLNPDGGIIQVEANEPVDADSRASIRTHLGHIAGAFQAGDFDIPMFVHNTVPPGVPEMKRLQKHIRYSFEETSNGGRVVISSTDHDAIAAIHRFLRFQITQHNTGDTTNVR